MTKLNQIIAVEKGVTNSALEELKNAYHRLQKSSLYSGISRNYRPRDDEGERLPSESTRVQVRVEKEIESVQDAVTRLFDVVATKDKTNTVATADIKLDNDLVLARNVPVPTLLYIEKKLTDLVTFVKKLPTLDPAEEWEWDPTADCWRTTPTETHRTKKVPKAFTKAAATDKHPAQVEVFTEDVIVGYWETVKFSGALAAERVHDMLERLEQLQKAVKFAREEANSQEVTDFKIGEALTKWIFSSHSS
jgi:hypothetical protein